jgi:hypothetical protein
MLRAERLTSERGALLEQGVSTYTVEIHRAFSSPSVHFGPFASIEDAIAWCAERQLTAIIREIHPVDTPTDVFAECWQ